MKQVIVFLLLISSCFAGKVIAQDDIIAKHLAAIGGIDAIKKLNSIYVEGVVSAQGFDLPMTKTVVSGKGAKMTFTFNGMEGYKLSRPDSGWNYMPFMGQSAPVAMDSTEFKETVDELDVVDNFLDYKEKGATASTIPEVTIDGKKCPGVKLTYKNGYTKSFYFDPATFYILRTVGVKTQNGSSSETQTDYSDHQKLPEGIVMAKKVTTPTATIAINKVTVNPTMDAAVFLPKGN